MLTFELVEPFPLKDEGLSKNCETLGDNTTDDDEAPFGDCWQDNKISTGSRNVLSVIQEQHCCNLRGCVDFGRLPKLVASGEANPPARL